MRRPGLLAACVVVLVADAGLLATSWDAFWAAGDEGYFGHTAERLLDGAVLDRDVESMHAGYQHFANAAAMAVFGRDLWAMRPPIMALAVVQSLLILLLLLPRGAVAAVVAAVASVALGLVQFCNGTHYWYTLPLAVGLACWLTWTRPAARLRLEVAGALACSAGAFHVLPGVLLGIAALVIALLEVDGDDAPGGPLAARALLAAGFAFVAWYLREIAEVTGVLLFGLCPLAVLGWAVVVVRASNRAVLRVTIRLALGALVAALPLLAYHVAHGSLAGWYDDVIVRSGNFPNLGHLREVSFRFWIASGAALLGQATSLGDVLNAVYWITLPCLSLATGLLLLVHLVRGGRTAARDAILPLVATLYALVSLRNQIPIYLYYSVPLAVAGWLWLAAGWAPAMRHASVAAAAALTAIGVAYHAGQPMVTYEQVLHGERLPLVPSTTLARLAHLRATPEQLALYEAMVAAIQRETAAGEPIFAFPYSPELYILAERPSAVSFHLLPIHLAHEADVTALRRALEEHPPALVVHRVDDKYNQPVSVPITETVQARFVPIEQIGPFVLYRPRAAAAP